MTAIAILGATSHIAKGLISYFLDDGMAVSSCSLVLHSE